MPTQSTPEVAPESDSKAEATQSNENWRRLVDKLMVRIERPGRLLLRRLSWEQPEFLGMTISNEARLTDRVLSKARHGIMMLPNQYSAETKSIANVHQTDLADVCPHQNSPLKSEIEKLKGAYLGVGNDKETDLSRPAGFRVPSGHADVEGAQAASCGVFSALRLPSYPDRTRRAPPWSGAARGQRRRITD